MWPKAEHHVFSRGYLLGNSMNVLFLCVANSARSQMAEGLARNIFTDNDVVVTSAGSAPTSVHRMAIEVMEECGLDIAEQYSKSIADINLYDIDLVITLCADEVCPYVPGKTKCQHWPLHDPAAPCECGAEQYQQFRQIRDELATRIEALKAELMASGKLTAASRRPRL